MQPTKPALSDPALIGIALMALTWLVDRFKIPIASDELRTVAESVVGLIGLIVTVRARWQQGDLHLVAPKNTTPPASGSPPAGTLALLLSLGVLCLGLGGCAATPTARWAQARSALTAAEQVLIQQAKAGNISPQHVVAADVLVKGARQALTLAEARLPDGGPQFDDYLRVIDSVLASVAQLQQQEAPSGTRGNHHPRAAWDSALGLCDAAGPARPGERQHHARTARRHQSPGEARRRSVGRHRGGGEERSPQRGDPWRADDHVGVLTL